MRKKVLIITCEMLPFPGKPVCGGGIRVWGLGNGLARAGHQVIYSLPAELAADDESLPDSIRANAHEPEKLNERILEIMPDLIIVEQWGLATYLDSLSIPLAIDLHGPLSLENAFKEGGNFLSDALTKIDALAKADFLICPGHLQKRYFYTWFLMAGADPLEAQLVVVPVGMPEEQPKKKKAKSPLLVYGGVAWPWIDPFPGLEIAGKIVDKTQGAGFELYVSNPPVQSSHPLSAINRNILKSYHDRLAGLRGVLIKDFVAHDQLIDRYTQATAAFDLYQANHERELAVTTRTVEYLWAGLPVIYAQYAELSRFIEQYDAGWLVDPKDEKAIEEAVSQALEKPEIAAKKGENARRLAADRFTWSASVQELLPLVEKPFVRKRTGTLLSGIRDYYRNESVEEILEGKNKLASLNDEIRHVLMEADKEKRDRDRRIEELGEQVREVIFEKDRQIRDLTAEHRKELDKKDDEIKRLLEKLDKETHTRDQEIQRLHKDRQLAESKLQDEIARLNKEKENDRKEAQSEMARINDRRIDEVAEMKKAKETESEKHLAEIKKLHEQLTLDAKSHSEQIKRLNDEKQELREKASVELKKVIEEKDKAFTELKRTGEKETARLQSRIDKLTEQTETTKKELGDEINSLNREKEQTRKEHEQAIQRLTAQSESRESQLRDQHDSKIAKYEEKLEAETERRKQVETELQTEIRQLNRERQELIARHDHELAAANERFEARLSKISEEHEKQAIEAQLRIDGAMGRSKSLEDELQTEIRQLNRERQELIARHDISLAEANQRFEAKLSKQREDHEAQLKELQARLDREVEKWSKTESDLQGEIRSLNRERQELVATHDKIIAELTGRHQVELSTARTGSESEVKELQRRLTRESEKHEEALKQMQDELRRINILREEDQRKASERIEKLQQRHEDELNKAGAQASREIERREKLLDRHGEKIAEIESRWQARLAAKDGDIDTLRNQLDELNAQITSRLTELDRIAAEKEIYVRESEKRFWLFEEKLTAQAREITVKSDELTAATAALAQADRNAKSLTAAVEQAKDDLAKLSRHAENLESEIPALRKRAELAEREVESFHERPGLKTKSRRAKRSGRLFVQLPRLAFLWGVNLVTNAYMELWQKRTGRRLFPGTKKGKKNGSEGAV